MNKLILIAMVATLVAPGVVSAEQQGGVAQASSQELLFARVGDQVITRDEYEQAFSRAMQSRFYHGRPPEGQVDVVRQEVADQIVARALRLQEARRLGLKADTGAIQATLDSYDERYRNSPRWQAQRTEMLAILGQRLEEEDLLRQLEKRIRDVEVPDRLQLEQYYETYPEKFTEPAQQKVSVILLRVDPSSSTEVWDAAMIEAAGLVSELRAGADFAELARLRSADRSAQAGGDMGYLHDGMLSPAAQEVVDALDIGVVSDPVRLLEGVAIFRVSERRQARLRAYSDVEQRVRALSTRQRGDAAWEAFNRRLASTTPVHIYPESGPSGGE